MVIQKWKSFIIRNIWIFILYFSMVYSKSCCSNIILEFLVHLNFNESLFLARRVMLIIKTSSSSSGCQLLALCTFYKTFPKNAMSWDIKKIVFFILVILIEFFPFSLRYFYLFCHMSRLSKGLAYPRNRERKLVNMLSNNLKVILICHGNRINRPFSWIHINLRYAKVMTVSTILVLYCIIIQPSIF